MRGLTAWFAVKVALLFSLVHGLGLLAPGLALRWLMRVFFSRGAGWFALGLPLLAVDFGILLLSMVLASGLAARIFNLRPSGECELDLDLREPEVQKWLLGFFCYLPTAVLLDLLHLYPLKTLHVRFFHGRVGRNSILGAMVTDPSLIEVGDDTVVGGFGLIMGHLVAPGRISFAKVRIGNRCGVGARSTVLAGATIEDGAILGAMSLLTRRSTIPAGQVWGGVPARPLRVQSDVGATNQHD